MLLQSTVGIPQSSRKHPLEKNAPMDEYLYAKEHLHISNNGNIVLRHESIKALTLAIP